ncbi:unnamed protein product [Triticum turgidum subsp. durum]|uniref:Thioredoxin domain-containing protein n=1 Tax=Triticum turgidum subsp. durum TaxID=4567 RepID=A0A9R1NRE0_TRITD|nr:unnamed protein product [Triticum turgidum subsp. durum]
MASATASISSHSIALRDLKAREGGAPAVRGGASEEASVGLRGLVAGGAGGGGGICRGGRGLRGPGAGAGGRVAAGDHGSCARHVRLRNRHRLQWCRGRGPHRIRETDWITGQRKDQSPGTRASIPVVQVDPSFEGLDGGAGSLIKWNPVANVDGKDIWTFLRTMDVPVNTLHAQGYVSIGCEPCTRPVLPGQHEREGRWWWEDATAKECGLHNGNIDKEGQAPKVGVNGNGSAEASAPDIFQSQAIVNLTRPGIENLLRLENRAEPWLTVLYAPWCPYCQAMEASYVELAEKLSGSGIKVAKFRADGEQKPFAQAELQLQSFPTILLFPGRTVKPIKYPSEKRDVQSLLAFVNSLR